MVARPPPPQPEMARVNEATATNSFFDKMAAFRPPILPQLVISAAWFRQMNQAVHLRGLGDVGIRGCKEIRALPELRVALRAQPVAAVSVADTVVAVARRLE
jgi:hypothetical protein